LEAKMSRPNVILVLIVVGAVLLALSVACGGGAEEPPAPPPAQESTGDLSGEELVEARCTRCHGSETTTGAAKTAQRWESTVDRMIAKGAELTDAEAQVLVDYLTENYGP
jgi:cytochrome c5